MKHTTKHAAFAYALAYVVGASASVNAAPPPVGSDDYITLKPYEDWVEHQNSRSDVWCCDLSDGRPVEARIEETKDGAHWVVHVLPEKFDDETDRWIEVPDEKIVKGGNPTGVAILWMWKGHVQCFAPPYGA